MAVRGSPFSRGGAVVPVVAVARDTNPVPAIGSIRPHRGHCNQYDRHDRKSTRWTLAVEMARARKHTRRVIATLPRHAGGRPRTVDRCPLGLTIERLAHRRGIHLDELARAAGISTPSLYRIMTGTIRSPRLATVKALASALDVGVEKLA